MHFEILIYETEAGKRPYEEWIRGMKDGKGRALVRARIDRLAVGNFGDHRHVGQAVWGLKIHFGPGYRVYYGMAKRTIILLLSGGDKSTQNRDIKNAIEYWNAFRRQQK